MPVITVELVNGELVRQGLQDLARSYPKVGRLSLYRVTQSIHRRHGIYPPKLPAQRYKRTNTLRQAREIVKTDKGYLIILNPVSKNGRPYLVYVRGAPTDASLQVSIHRNRWTPTVTILNEELAKLPQIVRDQVLQAIRQAAQETNRGATRSTR